MTRFPLRALPRAAALVFAGASSFLPVLAQAQSSTDSALDPVVVTGTRETQSLRNAVADIALIDNKTLRDSGVTTIEDALQRFGGLQMLKNGGPGHASGYLLRGVGTSSTVVLVDGVRVGSASLGQAAFEALSVDQIDRIEVLRGPASGLYGADAVGGVIQIFTKRGQGAFNLTANAQLGEYDSRDGSLGITGEQAGFDYAASIGRETSRGVSAIRPNDQFGNYNPDNDGFKRTVATGRLGFTPAQGHRVGVSATYSKLNSQYDSSNFLPDFSQDPTPDFRNHLKTSVVSADYRGELSSLWTTSLQVARNVDDSDSGSPGFMSRYKTERDQITWQNTLHLAPGQQAIVAYEHLKDRVETVSYVGSPKRTNKAVFAGYTGQFGPAAVEASLRSDDNSAYGTNTTGGVGASYALSSSLKLRASAGTSFRAPTFNDLYFPGYGIATIQPEKGRSFELGLNWASASTSAGVTAYRNKVRNLIGYNPDPNGTDCPAGYFGCAGNTSRATLKGVTLDGAHRLGNLQLRAAVDFLDAKDDDTGARLARRAAHQETLSADYSTGVWSVGSTLVFVGARPDGGARLGGYGTVDLRAAWRFMPQWRLEAKVLNVGDRDVQPVRDYQALGRQAWVGVRYDMKGF